MGLRDVKAYFSQLLGDPHLGDLVYGKGVDKQYKNLFVKNKEKIIIKSELGSLQVPNVITSSSVEKKKMVYCCLLFSAAI